MCTYIPTNYLDEQQDQIWDDLLAPDVPSYLPIGNEVLAAQYDFFEACTHDVGYSSGYRIYLPATDSTVRISGISQTSESLPGRWAIVFSNAFGHVHERFVNPEDTALEAARVIATSGYIPEGVDKVFCTRSINKRYLEEMGDAASFETVVNLYGMKEAIIPEDALLFQLATYDDLNEPLHTGSGYVKSYLQPKPECMDLITENCERVIRCCAGMSLDYILPMKAGSSRRPNIGDGERANIAFKIYRTLSCGLDDTPEIREVPRGNLAQVIDPRIGKNQFPIQALKAAQIKRSYLEAAQRQQDVCRIWKTYLDHYGIEISRCDIDRHNLDYALEKVERLGRDLGVFPAVKAVLSGVPVEDVLASIN